MKSLEDQITELTTQITALTLQRARLLMQQALENTPLRPGMRVTYDGAKGAVWEIMKITPGYSADNPRIYGAKIKKDGTPSLIHSEIQWRKPTKASWEIVA